MNPLWMVSPNPLPSLGSLPRMRASLRTQPGWMRHRTLRVGSETGRPSGRTRTGAGSTFTLNAPARPERGARRNEEGILYQEGAKMSCRINITGIFDAARPRLQPH
jgi:hypothetical protein